jgi:dTMP kinase
MEELYTFALVPDLVIYLDIDVEQLLPRVLSSTGFDYWESGQDFLRGSNVYSNVYESFVQYQQMLLAEFRRLAKRHGFTVVDARRTVSQIHQTLRSVVDDVVRGMEEWPVGSTGTEQLHMAHPDGDAHDGLDGVEVTRSERAAPSG